MRSPIWRAPTPSRIGRRARPPLEHLAAPLSRVLDLGSGDGRLRGLVRLVRRDIEASHSTFPRQCWSDCERGLPSNKLLDVHAQIVWPRDIGFLDVDCHWRWRELALIGGTTPGARRSEAALPPART